MQDVINSMVRFSGAVTLFSLQQFQNAISAVADSENGLEKVRKALDSASKALTSHIDESQKTALNSITNLSSDLVSRTFDTFKVSALDPRQVLETTGDIVRRTSETIDDVVKKSDSKKSSSEPRPAAEALS
jgi:hypothetical protein